MLEEFIAVFAELTVAAFAHARSEAQPELHCRRPRYALRHRPSYTFREQPDVWPVDRVCPTSNAR